MPHFEEIALAFNLLFVLSLTTFLCRWLKPAELEDVPENRAKNPSLEGLRGLLAIGVFYHHAAVNYRAYHTGLWKSPDEKVLALLAPIPVTLFFFLTGYLFWIQRLDSRKEIDWLTFYKSRAKRLIPAYVSMLVLMLCAIFALSAFQLRAPLSELARQIGPWLLFGLPYGHFPIINGYPNNWLMVAQIWTLQFEWLFYFFFPLLKKVEARVPLIVVFIFFVGLWVYLKSPLGDALTMNYARYKDGLSTLKDFSKMMTLGFAGGLFTAELSKWKGHPRLGERTKNFLAVLCLPMLLIASPTMNHWNSLILFFFFYLVVHQNALKTMLHLKGVRFLGMVSYSFYLLHGLCLYLYFLILNHWHPLSQMPLWVYEAHLFGCASILVAVSTLNYFRVERPFLSRTNKINDMSRLQVDNNPRPC